MNRKTEKNGILYGIGVGPGDPELMTLKAVKRIRESDIIAVPLSGRKKQSSLAYDIAKKAYPPIEEKERLTIYFPMTKDEGVLKDAHKKGTEEIKEYLEMGKQVGFLTLGDPTVYSTYMYIHKRIREEGFEAEIVNGIPSFCAAAAALSISLGENNEPIHIIPAAYGINEDAALKGTNILMKAGKQMGEVKKGLAHIKKEVYGAENCGMESERLYRGFEQIPEDGGYYSMIILKDF